MSSLFYQFTGELPYEKDVLLTLSSVKQELHFTKMSEHSDKNVLSLTPHMLSAFTDGHRRIDYSPALEKIADRKVIFVSVKDDGFQLLKSRDITRTGEYFSDKEISVNPDYNVSMSNDPFDRVLRTTVSQIMQSEKIGKVQYSELLKRHKKYTLAEILSVEKNLPVFLGASPQNVNWRPENKELANLYAWQHTSHLWFVLPKNRSLIYLDSLGPVLKHELNHTFNQLNIDDGTEGRNLYTAGLDVMSNWGSCADVVDCVGVCLAFFMERWEHLGARCNSSIEAYQKKLGEMPIKPFKKLYSPDKKVLVSDLL